MSMFVKFLIVSLILEGFVNAEKWGSVKIKDDKCVFFSSKLEDSDAWGVMNEPNEGWNELEIWGNSGKSDHVQARAVGCLEGFLSVDIGWAYYSNVQPLFFPNGTIDEKLLAFIEEQEAWVENNVISFPKDAYWTHVGLILVQRDGLIEGYMSGSHISTSIPKSVLHALSLSADLEDLGKAVSIQNGVHTKEQTYREKLNQHYMTPHCSAVIRKTEDDLFVGHATWFIYPGMVRIMKTYHMNLSAASTSAKSIRQSSYPLSLSSNDDFYAMSSGLVVTETTFGVYNTSLYEKITPNCVLSWHRGLVASRMATTSMEWVDIFSRYISGSQNNQWIVVDYNNIGKLSSIWIIEVEPIDFEVMDITDIVNSVGYWGSYNVPRSKRIFENLGYAEQEKQHGPDMFSYTECVRRKIFDRNAPKVNTYEEFKTLIRYNDYKHDPLSKDNPEYSIDSRLDLSGEGPFGCVDAKAVSQSRIIKDNLTISAQSGPTHDNTAPFDWSAYPSWHHSGIPSVVSFEWIESKAME